MKAGMVFLTAILICASVPLLAQNRVSMTVAGFVNLGESEYDYVNGVMTVSMISLLMKVFPDVTSLEEVERAVRQNGFWSRKDFDAQPAILMAESFGSQFCVTGTYRVARDRSVKLSLFLYDIPSRELKLAKSYTGSLSGGVFAATDRMIKDVLFMVIGRTAELGTLRVKIADTGSRYSLVVNGKRIAEVSTGTEFESPFLAGEVVRVQLIHTESGREVYRTNTVIARNSAREVFYSPRGTILIRSEKPGQRIVIDGTDAGVTDENGILIADGLIADRPVELDIRDFGSTRMLERVRVRVREGETKEIRLGNASRARFALEWDLGVKGFAGFGGAFTKAGFWPGGQGGGGIASRVRFVRDLFFPGSWTGLEGYCLYSRDAFYPSPEYYDPGSYVVSDNVRYGFNLFFRFPSGWYAGAGPLFSWTFSGEYGSADRRGAFSSEMTGLDIAISVCGGYEWEWIRDRLSVPVGAQWNAILTVPGVVLMEFGIHAGLIWRTGFFSDPDEERP